MMYTKFEDHQPVVLEKIFKDFFTIYMYGYGGHLYHI